MKTSDSRPMTCSSSGLIWLFVFLSFASLSSSIYNFKPCYYATPNKPFGRYYYHSEGMAFIEPYVSTWTRNKDICNNNCRVSDECWATSFDISNNNCSFYNTSNFQILDGQTSLEYSQWFICNMSEGYLPSDGRCRGQWIIYMAQCTSVTSYENLEIHFLEMYSCREKCLENSLCGFVNFRTSDNRCQLVPKWPYSNLNHTSCDGNEVHRWTCIDNFVGQIKVKKEIFKPLVEKCTGYWTISSRNRRVNGGNITGLFFQTQIYQQCLDECNQYANCFATLYNVTYSICILPNISEGQTVLPQVDTRFLLFDWKCVRNDSHNPYKNEDEKRYESLGMRCYQIKNNTRLFIGEDQCGKHPKLSSFVQCDQVTSTHESIQWDIRQSCLVNQTYWSFPAQVVQMNVSGWMNLTKIYTGIQQYWLAYSDDDKFREVDYMVCRSFNASRPLERLKDTDIISRIEWQSQDKRGPFKLLHSPVFIDVSSSHMPHHSCKTRPACIDSLRTLQVRCFSGCGNNIRADIPYNFMIDDSGHVYECRGWKFRSEAVGRNNIRTLSIAYIGWFRYQLPNERFLNSLKKLIEYSVDKGHVVKNYTLYIQQDLATTAILRNFEIVMKNWYRYRGFLPEDCSNYSLPIICLNVVTVLLLCLLLYIFYSMNSFKKFCSKCVFLDFEDVTLKQIFPCEANTESLSSVISNCKHYENHCIIYQKSSFISSANQSPIVKLIKIWLLNQFLETMNSRHNQNSFNNYLSSFPQTKGRSFIYKIEFKEKEESASREDVILCVNDASGLELFQRLVKTRCCLCCYFRSDHIDLTTIVNDVRVIK